MSRCLLKALMRYDGIINVGERLFKLAILTVHRAIAREYNLDIHRQAGLTAQFLQGPLGMGQ